MISVPMDLQKAQVDPVFWPQTNIPKPRADSRDIEEVLRRIVKSDRPVIWAGGGVNGSGANEALMKFSELMNIPVITTWLRNDIISNNHHLYLGSAGFGAPKSVFDFLLSSDLILAIGCRFSEFSTRTYGVPQPNAAVVNIDIEPEGSHRVISPALSVISDAKLALEDLLSAAKAQWSQGDLDRMKEKFGKGVKEAREALLKVSSMPDGQYRGRFIHPGILIQEIQKTLDEDALIVTDSGSFMAWVGRFYQFKRPRTLIAPAGGAMGFGFPAAIGAQLAQPKRRVISITGDGGFMMVLQELETAVRYKTPVVVVVMNNFCFANVKEKQLKTYGGRVIGSEYSNPDFAQLAKLFGAHGERVEKTAEIVPAMKRALDSGLPSVLDVIVDPELTLPPIS